MQLDFTWFRFGFTWPDSGLVFGYNWFRVDFTWPESETLPGIPDPPASDGGWWQVPSINHRRGATWADFGPTWGRL